MADLYIPSESEIRTWAGDQSFTRGSRYFRDGAITQPRRQGRILKAQCYGSTSAPYRVEVTLGAKAVEAAACSCPVGGHCKHVVALLLTWRNDPQSFVEIEEIDSALNRRTKEELVHLIKLMLSRQPELETLLDLPLPGGVQHSKRLEPSVIERQVAQVFRSWDGDYGSTYGMVGQLDQIRQLGEQYSQAGDWANAITVFTTLATGVLEHYELDQDGELATVVDECVTGLKAALDAVHDQALRERALLATFEIYRWDIDAGGYGVGDATPELLLAMTTPAEKRMIAGWVRTALPPGKTWSEEYHRQTYGALLLGLEAETLDDESFLRICRETGRVLDLVGRLLVLQRVDEANAAAKEASDYELLTLAPVFTTAGQEERYAQIVAERVQSNPDARLKEWLRDWMQRHGKRDQVLALTQELFWMTPSLEGYVDLKKVAESLNRWEAMRPRLLEQLRRDKHWYTLIKIHLHEAEIDEALAAVNQPPANPYGISWLAPLRLEVAQAAEASRPQQALAIYQEAVRQQIAQRARGNYAQAAELLVRMRPIYERLGRMDDWRRYVTNIRQQNSRLRALQDELNQAQLPA